VKLYRGYQINLKRSRFTCVCVRESCSNWLKSKLNCNSFCLNKWICFRMKATQIFFFGTDVGRNARFWPYMPWAQPPVWSHRCDDSKVSNCLSVILSVAFKNIKLIFHMEFPTTFIPTAALTAVLMMIIFTHQAAFLQAAWTVGLSKPFLQNCFHKVETVGGFSFLFFFFFLYCLSEIIGIVK